MCFNYNYVHRRKAGLLVSLETITEFFETFILTSYFSLKSACFWLQIEQIKLQIYKLQIYMPLQI